MQCDLVGVSASHKTPRRTSQHASKPVLVKERVQIFCLFLDCPLLLRDLRIQICWFVADGMF